MRWYGLPLPGKRKGLPRLAAALCQGLWASQNCAVDVQALCLPRQNGFQMRAREGFSPGCQGTPRVKPHEKSRLFSDRGAKLFYGQRFSAETLFSVHGFVRLRGRGRGLSLWRYPIMEQERKAVSPASASPWRTPANRCRTRLFPAPNSPAFRGSQQPLVAFPLEEPTRNFPPVCMN